VNASGAYLALLLSAAAFLLSVFSFIYFRLYLKRSTSQERILAEIQTEVNNILKSIDETTDRDISLIEEREKNLRSLLEDIDKRLKTYIREMDSRRDADNAYAALQTKKTDKPASNILNNETYHELGKNRYRLQKRSAQEEHAVVPPSPPPAEEMNEEPDKENPAATTDKTAAYPLPKFRVKSEAINEQMRELLRAGLSPALVASRLGVSIAEAELAAALMERQGKY